jgi:drug/metabolite transporter (DMT)-like permease
LEGRLEADRRFDPLMGMKTRISARSASAHHAYRQLPDMMRGTLWLVASAGFFTAMTLLIKSLHGYAPPVQALYSQAAGLLLMMPLVLRSRGKVLVLNGVWMQLGRSLSAALGVTLSYYAVQKLPLADANAISFTRGLWIGPLAALVLRDRVAATTWAALIMGFLGVLLIAHPSTATAIGWAHLAAIVSAFLLALSVTGIKLLTRKNKVATIMVWSSILGVVLLFPAAAGTWRWPSATDFLWLTLLGGVSVATTATYIHGMAIGDAAKLASVDYIRLPFAIIAGFLAFGEVPGLWTVLGASIIVGTAIWAAISEHRAPVVEPAATI